VCSRNPEVGSTLLEAQSFPRILPIHYMNSDLILPDIAEADFGPAKLLQVELTTRIATQQLHYRSGDEETALQSVHEAFKLTRKLLTNHPQAGAFEMVGIFLINRILRPYTARWHRWLVDKRFIDERSRRQFRYELKQLQPRLLEIVELLKLLTQGQKQSEAARKYLTKVAAQTPEPTRHANLGGPVSAGIGPEVQIKSTHLPPDLSKRHAGGGSQKSASVEKINGAEKAAIHERRAALRPNYSAKTEDPLEDASGISLSGGGIRSATFCLGIVQVLAQQSMLSECDYISTVSGGGYLGTFLTSFLGTPKKNLPEDASPALTGSEIRAVLGEAFGLQNGHESAAVRHIRNNSRYLLSGGLWGRFKVFGLLITGIFTNIIIVLPIPFACALIVFGMHRFNFWDPIWPHNAPVLGTSPARGFFLIATYCLVVAWLGLPMVRNWARGNPPNSKAVKFRNAYEAITIISALIFAAAGVLLILPMVFAWMDSLAHFWPLHRRLSLTETVIALASLLPLVFGLLTARLKSGVSKKTAAVLFTLSGPTFYFFAFLLVATNLFYCRWPWLSLLIGTALALLWSWLLLDINEFSPHRYYRARLCECYLAVRQDDQTGLLRNSWERFFHGSKRSEIAGRTGVGTRRQLRLSQINATGAAPYHLLNAALNLPSSHEPELRGRDCDFYLFSRYYCGSPACGYIRTEEIEILDPHIDLGTAMAISGAAAASNMGVKTQRQYRFLLTLLNVRLGYWLRNPLAGVRNFLARPGPLYLFREMFGWMHEKSPYLNLSDGGHIENLALYELLRRRCKFIVAVDGGMEAGMECADLMLAQRYAQIDLGLQFDLDIADLALDANRRTRAYAVFGKIRYSLRPGQTKEDIGWLLYIKLACTGGEPGYIVDYRRQNPDFPHQTTSDQIYDEAQFEAYRRLGECAAESLFRPELAGIITNPLNEPLRDSPRFRSLRDWFQALADNLLPDNDPAF
jgi:hypothetical protein